MPYIPLMYLISYISSLSPLSLSLTRPVLAFGRAAAAVLHSIASLTNTCYHPLATDGARAYARLRNVRGATFQRPVSRLHVRSTQIRRTCWRCQTCRPHCPGVIPASRRREPPPGRNRTPLRILLPVSGSFAALSKPRVCLPGSPETPSALPVHLKHLQFRRTYPAAFDTLGFAARSAGWPCGGWPGWYENPEVVFTALRFILEGPGLPWVETQGV